MIALTLFLALVMYGLLAWFALRVLGWLGKACAFPVVSTKALQGFTLALFVLLPTWDIIPSRLYFQHLCEHEAGVKVFKIAEIDRAYFKQDGKPDHKQLLEHYAQYSKHDPKFSSWAHITKVEGGIQDRQTNELLGTVTDFVYYGGWLGSRIDPMSPMTCPKFPNHIVHDLIWQAVFKQK